MVMCNNPVYPGISTKRGFDFHIFFVVDILGGAPRGITELRNWFIGVREKDLLEDFYLLNEWPVRSRLGIFSILAGYTDIVPEHCVRR